MSAGSARIARLPTNKVGAELDAGANGVVSLALNSETAAQAIRARLRVSAAPLRGPLLLALAYFLGAEAAFFIGTLSDQIFALFWPPNVILFCALLVVPQRQWLLYIAAAFVAHVVAELQVGMPVPQLIVAFVTNCLVALLNAYGVRRLIGGPPWFGTFRNASLYIVITAGIGPAIAALGGAFVPIMGGGALADYWLFWSYWYLANALPSLTIGPVFLIWFTDGARWSRWIVSRRQIEPALLALALAAVCLIAVQVAGTLFASSFPAAVLLLFAPLPLLLWAAVRHGEKGASAAILIVTVVLTWRTLNGPGLFPDEAPERSLLALQLFLMGLSIPVLLLGALIDELRRAEGTTRQLAASLLTAQDEERRRIARDLHDSTGQNLIAATLIAGRVQDMLPASAGPLMDQLEDVLQQAIREVRTVSYLLHPPLLDEAGLAPALREYVDGYIERSGIGVDLEVARDFGRLPPETELVLFRLVQEALTNVARHSHSPTARIRFTRQGNGGGPNVVLTVEDEGRGMPGAGRRGLIGGRRAPTRGVGLASMRERLNQVGGRLEIESAVGRTIVRAVIPLREPAAN
jgi:signal transduction histidine kinase